MVLYFSFQRCTAKAEEDYRRLFDQFLHDLLSALYTPEWPAAEMMLCILGNLLVTFYRSKTMDMSLRIARSTLFETLLCIYQPLCQYIIVFSEYFLNLQLRLYHNIREVLLKVFRCCFLRRFISVKNAFCAVFYISVS